MKIVSHIPHSSLMIPADIREQFVISDEELRAELHSMTDHFTEELFCQAAPAATDVIFPVSRLVVDPERFENDADEPMASIGMGVIYEQSSTGNLLRRKSSPIERQRLLVEYYRPHHARLSKAVGEALQDGEKCLVLDCHSFPATALPYELGKYLQRLEICIGTDAFHTPDWLTALAVRTFQNAGFSVAVNEPFAGALVPSAFYQTDDRVLALMVEIRRDMYVDESTGQKAANFADFRQKLHLCISKIKEGSYE